MGLLEKFRRIMASEANYSKRDEAAMTAPIPQRTAGAACQRIIPTKATHHKRNKHTKRHCPNGQCLYFLHIAKLVKPVHAFNDVLKHALVLLHAIKGKEVFRI